MMPPSPQQSKNDAPPPPSNLKMTPLPPLSTPHSMTRHLKRTPTPVLKTIWECTPPPIPPPPAHTHTQSSKASTTVTRHLKLQRRKWCFSWNDHNNRTLVQAFLSLSLSLHLHSNVCISQTAEGTAWPVLGFARKPEELTHHLESSAATRSLYRCHPFCEPSPANHSNVLMYCMDHDKEHFKSAHRNKTETNNTLFFSVGRFVY